MSKLILLALAMCCAISAVSADMKSCDAVLVSGKLTDATKCFNKLVGDKSIWAYVLRTYAGDVAESLLATLRSQNLVEKFANRQIDTKAWVRDNRQRIDDLNLEYCDDFKSRSDLYLTYLAKSIASSQGQFSLTGAIRSGHGIAASIVMQEACSVLQK